jgi:uncharacterized membrane protein (UPF0136 family)
MSVGIIAAIAYGVLTIVGGIMGYAKAQSKISLIAGCACGLALVLSAALQALGYAWGAMLAVVVTAVLIFAFVARFAKTRQFMPAGLMMILGLIALGVMVGQWGMLG